MHSKELFQFLDDTTVGCFGEISSALALTLSSSHSTMPAPSNGGN